MGIYGNLNINQAKKRLPYPTAGLNVIVYPDTYEDGGTTYYKTSTGVGLDVVGQDGGEDIINFAPLLDARFDKGSYVGNAFGLPEYYDSPWDDYFYYNDASEATRYWWKRKDFHYANLLAQGNTLQNVFFLKAKATTDTSNEIDPIDRLYIYDAELTGTLLTKIRTHINVIGKTIAFDGVNQYLHVQDNGNLDVVEATTDYCMSGYIRTKSDITSVQYLIGKSIAGNYKDRYGIAISSGDMILVLQDDSNAYLISDNIVLSTNTEYHLLLRVDLSNKKIYYYIDGILQNAGGTSYTGSFGNLANDYYFMIAGAQREDTIKQNFADIEVRDVRVYHKNVVPNISDLMNGVELGDEVAWWKCNGITDDNKVLDETGNYDMTAVNAPTLIYYYKT